ncbi:hypothetical protein [Streptomyces sp. FIT100]|uniref:hypothetical protein n=1 Tax=Streptomyces sp. FIT100 TaxID=2837956 RepID=UPI0021CA94B3|nr:hypothetical protein [Streptomyces sp. FIT100]UUN26548.1 hypothetical protein KK483_09065 [Streptomyces sp. FIT100]
MGGLRHDRLARTARPTALASAVATLLAALFVCLGGQAEADTAAHAGDRPGFTAAPGAASHTAYDCPYDRGDCGLFPHLGPAVLTAPPLDGPLDSAGPAPGPAGAHHAVRAPRTGALPRAPDLHVLQVLRT